MKPLLAALLITALLPISTFAAANNVTISVNGLVCAFCAIGIEKAFNKQEAIDTVKVDMDAKKVWLTFKEGQSLDNPTITDIIEDSGYNVESINRE